ncbi:ADP-ribose glycohydrolase MACROD1 isoform X1 [Gadus chalcogrammus]|uniref:ADP-ribose glycohydrolase MACROD1 isoform X1 n=1 Tax=Gadus chalcogrammus TaxID=1042646 RepID=UPI0024C4DECB|nr:ADP-ribose glycohydrolase MACROD1 isoform X1 [Gadus chalcogrammus]
MKALVDVMSRIIVGLLFTPCNMTFKTSILLPRIRILSSAGRLSGNRLDFMHVKNISSTAGFRPKRPLTLLFGSVRRNVSAECNWGSQMFAKQSSTATRWNKLSTTTTLQKDGFTRSRERGVLLRKVVLGALGFATTAAVCVHTSARVTMAEGTESLKVNLESAEADWKETKDRMLSLPLDERRRFYRTRCYTSLDQVPVWSPSPGPSSEHQRCPRNKKLDGRISLYTGDITQLEVDAIVNADVIHTVGPIVQRAVGDQERRALRASYRSSLEAAAPPHVAARSLAFPCISTGIYGYPPDQAVHVALATVREYLDEHPDKLDRVIFCVFLPADRELYLKNLPLYFPGEAAVKSKL